jgi:hypothetical protein
VQKILKGNTVYLIIKVIQGNNGKIYLYTMYTRTGKLPNYLKDYMDMVLEKEANILPEHTKHDHVIKLEPGKDLLYWPIYNLLEKELAILYKYIKEALAKR